MISEKVMSPLGPEDAKRFCDVCLASGYTQSRLSEISGLLVPPPSDRLPPEVEASLREGGAPLHLLASLFFLGIPVDAELAGAVLPSGFLSLCKDCGLIVEDGQSLRAVALVVPVGESLFASDLQRIEHQEDDRFVPTVCDAALHLSAVAIGKPVGKTLDLCSGFALHGILSSPLSEEVVASDLNPRAEEFARFNAALNSRDNLRAVTGDLFSAVEGERFDLILANPPFIISPEAVTTFRYSQYELDGFVQTMLTRAHDYLEEGGVLQTICEWVELEGQDWQERVQGWFADCGCDAWILPANRQFPSSYSRSILQQTISDETELSLLQSQWERYFRDQKVEAIQGGFIFLRRRQGKNWFDVTQLTKPIQESIGEAVAQGFASRDLVFHEDGDKTLLAARLVVVNGLRQVENSHWKDSRWQRNSIVLHLDHGLPVTIGIDEYVRSLIEKFDGIRTVEQGLSLFAKEVGLPIESGQSQGLQIVRAMLKNGVLAIQS